MISKWAIATVFVIAAVGASAQTAPPAQTRTITASMGFPGTAHLGPGVKGKPYSAQRVTEHTQTLADGTHVTQKPLTVQLYRDSAGRMRTERPLIMVPNLPSDIPVVVIIDDPVEGYQYTVDTVNHLVHRVKATPFTRPNGTPANTGQVVSIPHISTSPPAAPAVNAPVQHTTPDGRTMTTENLGTQSIEGVLAQGHRTTTVIPAGLEGNDAPMTTVNETWMSQQLAMVVLSKNTDPRNGENTMRLTNIVLGEPDPSLFQPPPSYEIVDETGSFQIKFTYTVPLR